MSESVSVYIVNVCMGVCVGVNACGNRVSEHVCVYE
jgi:hypothetical protein